jgi:hypothetical protein
MARLLSVDDLGGGDTASRHPSDHVVQEWLE